MIPYSMALCEGKPKWADGTSDDPAVLSGDVPPWMLIWAIGACFYR